MIKMTESLANNICLFTDKATYNKGNIEFLGYKAESCTYKDADVFLNKLGYKYIANDNESANHANYIFYGLVKPIEMLEGK